jgi:hypothetical protein
VKTSVFNILLIFSLCGCNSFKPVERDPATLVQMDPKSVTNKLQAFTAHGCPQFPYSIDYPNQEKWNLCCVQHDIAYWKGGTSDERLDADKQLRQCVIEQGEPNAAALVYLGVRNQDSEAFPTEAHWGYGWVLNHGYTPLTADEKMQVEKLEPSDLRKIHIPPPAKSTVQLKDSLTKNFCVDGVVTFIQHQLRRTLTPMNIAYNQESSGMGYLQTITITDQYYAKPYEFKFYMNKEKACMTPPSKWPNGMHIELKSFAYPEY